MDRRCDYRDNQHLNISQSQNKYMASRTHRYIVLTLYLARTGPGFVLDSHFQVLDSQSRSSHGKEDQNMVCAVSLHIKPSHSPIVFTHACTCVLTATS